MPLTTFLMPQAFKRACTWRNELLTSIRLCASHRHLRLHAHHHRDHLAPKPGAWAQETLSIHPIGPGGDVHEPEDGWAAATGLAPDGALLVRPDSPRTRPTDYSGTRRERGRQIVLLPAASARCSRLILTISSQTR